MAEVDDQLARLTARAEHVVPSEDLGAKLVEGRPLRVKLGMDPTAKDVTLGWAVPLRKLRQFQDEGHVAVLIVGDFTARIGDPSDRSQTRPQLSKETVKANADALFDQFWDILSKDNVEIRYNSEWLEPLDLTDVLRITSQYTVAQMLERDDFRKRYEEQRPISIVEFMYPLMQAYDSIAVQADVELGGTDQLFNLLVGRDLQRAFGQSPQVALTMPLLEGLDGVQKMSQSLDNYVAIREEPNEMFGKLMSIPDHVVGKYALLAAGFNEDEVSELVDKVIAGGPQAAEAKRRVARATVAIYHGEVAADEAEMAFDRVFRESLEPEDVTEFAIPEPSLQGEFVHIPSLLATLNVASSKSEARRLIRMGAVRIDGDRVEEELIPLSTIVGSTIRVGRRRFFRLRA